MTGATSRLQCTDALSFSHLTLSWFTWTRCSFRIYPQQKKIAGSQMRQVGVSVRGSLYSNCVALGNWHNFEESVFSSVTWWLYHLDDYEDLTKDSFAATNNTQPSLCARCQGQGQTFIIRLRSGKNGMWTWLRPKSSLILYRIKMIEKKQEAEANKALLLPSLKGRQKAWWCENDLFWPCGSKIRLVW